MPKQRTRLIGDCAQRCRDAQAELDDALRELEAAVNANGWCELQRHEPAAGSPMITYVRPDSTTIDAYSGLPAGEQIRTLDSFIRDGA